MPEAAPVKPEEFRAMASGINRVATAAEAMMKSGLSEDALVILLHHRTRVAQRDIREVLKAQAHFAELYLTPEYRKLIKEQK